MRTTHITVVISPLVVLIAVGSSTLVGVVFGIYPVHQAARRDASDALRFA